MAKRERLRAVRLSDIPVSERMKAARIAARECGDADAAANVIAAAMFPSDRVYWVRVDEPEHERAAA